MNVHQRSKDHISAARSIAAALILDLNPSTLDSVAFVLRSRLSPNKRTGLLHAALFAAEVDDVRALMNEILPDYLAGAPLPALLEIEVEANWWADFATLPELRAYLLAIYARLPASDKRAFIEAVTRRAAA